MKKSVAVLLAIAFLFSLVLAVYAERPAQNVDWSRHPNLAAAQALIDKAFDKVVAAQKANEYDMDGHAQKAKDLLDEANRQIKLAALAANKNGK
jgi:F0F1-type ATP synthase membrane subunit b/b'